MCSSSSSSLFSGGAVSRGEEASRSEGNVVVQLLAIEPYLARMEVAVLPDERQHVVLVGKSFYEEIVSVAVEPDGHRVLFLFVERFCGRGLSDERGFLTVGPPVDGVDGNGVIVEDGDGSGGVGHGADVL